MDLYEDTQSNIVTATFELPGLAKENLKIDADVINHRLTISGEHNTSANKEDKEKGFTVRERQYGKFTRSLPLPHGLEVGCTASQMSLSTHLLTWYITAWGGQSFSQRRRPDGYVPEDHAGAGAYAHHYRVNRTMVLSPERLEMLSPCHLVYRCKM